MIGPYSSSEPTYAHVEMATLGDSRRAVVEKNTREPVQYATAHTSDRALLARWDAAFQAAADRATRGGR